MKTRLTSPSDSAPTPDGFPDADSLAALRAWYAGLPTREAVARYLPGSAAMGQSARGILGRIRRQLVTVARGVHREDLAMLFGVFVKAMLYYSETKNVESTPILGITLPIWMGVGGLVLGVVLMLLSRLYFRAFFSRKTETAPPGLLDQPVEHAPAHF